MTPRMGRIRPTGRRRPTAEEAPMRVQKYLSRTGTASRREAERLMLQGRVRVNGRVVTTLGVKVRPGEDRVEVDGRRVEESPLRWVLFHKTRGSLTTRDDPGGRPTVYDLLPREMEELRYVGRLDQDTEGLLLLTNEGDALHRLTHPSWEVEREYLVWVATEPSRRALRRLEEGVELEDGPARAENVRVVERKGGKTVLSLVVREGRKREVRRLMEHVGHPAVGLRRVRFGPVRLGDLPVGQWRDLNQNEIRALKARVRLEEEP